MDYQLTVDSPLRIQEEAKCQPVMAPELGEHSFEVLRELGFTETQSQTHIAAGVVRDGRHSGGAAN